MKLQIYIQRFVIVYFILYTIPFPLSYLPLDLGDTFQHWTTSIWKLLVPFFSEHLFGVEKILIHRVNGSGDSLFYYLKVPALMVISLLVCFVWFGLPLKWKRSNRNVFRFFLVYIRYYLAFTMFTYGFAKVFYLQFHELSLSQLTQEFGDASPMGLLWKFMGYSETYSIFTGLVEVITGFLLLFRNTKVLGACVCFGVMIQIFMLNMSFDVPVKLYSFHLVIISIIILTPYLPDLVDFFIRRKPTNPMDIEPYSKNRRINLFLHISKYTTIIMVLVSLISDNVAKRENYGKRAKKNILYGIYEVDFFLVNNDTIEPSRRNSKRWDRLIIDKNDALVEQMNRDRVGMRMVLDSVNSKLMLTSYLDESDQYNLSFRLLDNGLILFGESNENNLRIKLFKKDREELFLEKRGFNWVNEYPMNR